MLKKGSHSKKSIKWCFINLFLVVLELYVVISELFVQVKRVKQGSLVNSCFFDHSNPDLGMEKMFFCLKKTKQSERVKKSLVYSHWQRMYQFFKEQTMQIIKTSTPPIFFLNKWKIFLICLVTIVAFSYCSDDGPTFSTEYYSTSEVEEEDAEEDDGDSRRRRRRRRRSSSSDDSSTSEPDPVQSSAPAVDSETQRPLCPPKGKSHLKILGSDNKCYCPAGKYQFYGDRCCKLCKDSNQRIRNTPRSCECYTPAECPPSGKPHLTQAIVDKCYCPAGKYEFYGDRCCKLCKDGNQIIDPTPGSCECIDRSS